MRWFIGRHRIRANFYHLSAILFLVITLETVLGRMSDSTAFICTSILFVADYIAEMFDPHPDNMGHWYSYFHRFYDNSED